MLALVALLSTFVMFGDKTDKSLPKNKTVHGYTVRKLVLREYIEVFEKLERIPQQIAKLDSIDEKNIAQHIGPLVSGALPDVIELLAIVTGENAEKLGSELDLAQAIDLIAATIEVNDFLGVWNTVKGVIPTTPKTIQSGSQG